VDLGAAVVGIDPWQHAKQLVAPPALALSVWVGCICLDVQAHGGLWQRGALQEFDKSPSLRHLSRGIQLCRVHWRWSLLVLL